MSATTRKKLFSDDPEPARAVGLRELERRGAGGSDKTWWAFEGFTEADCCLETPGLVLVIEGKRTERLSPATKWYPERNQLWRNVEVAKEAADGRQYGVIVAVETEAAGLEVLLTAQETLDKSYPPLARGDRDDLNRHLLGYVTLAELVRRFELPASCLQDTREHVVG